MKEVHWIKVLFDLIVLGVIGLMLILLKHLVKPNTAGFHCNDFTVNVPFKSSTVTNIHLIFISVVVPVLFIFTSEIIKAIYQRSLKRSIKYRVKLCHQKVKLIPEFIGDIYVNIGALIFGVLVANLLTNCGKVIAGRLRPNFLSVCKPNIDPYNIICKQSNVTYLIPGVHFTCLAEDPNNVIESSKSFPSGHSSLSTYAMLFLILYVEFNWRFHKFGLWPRFVQFCLAAVAIFTCMSRVSDNKHHPTDVVAGALLGLVIAVLTFVFLTNFVRKNEYKCDYNVVETNAKSETPFVDIKSYDG